MTKALTRSFGGKEGKYTESWKPFFQELDNLQNIGDHESVSPTAVKVLKTLVWSADAVASASLSSIPEQRNAYADVTRFIDVWGDYAPQIVLTENSLKLEGERITNNIVKDVSKYKCNRYGHQGHLIAMCYAAKEKKHFRSGPNKGKHERDDREDFDRPRGYAPGFGGKRGVSRDRGLGRL